MRNEIVSGIERPVPERVYCCRHPEVCGDVVQREVHSRDREAGGDPGAAKALGSQYGDRIRRSLLRLRPGGCVEASVAAKAMIAMEQRRDRLRHRPRRDLDGTHAVL